MERGGGFGGGDQTSYYIFLFYFFSGRGWSVVVDLEEAIKLATSRAFRRHQAQGDVSGIFFSLLLFSLFFFAFKTQEVSGILALS